MNENGRFYKKGELDTRLIVPAYQEAFKGWPWYEVSKCVDDEAVQRCAGGLSRTALNALCGTCGDRPNQPAYETKELVDRFTMLEGTRPTMWYLESIGSSPALAALAWTATPATIAEEKYQNVPDMQAWMTDRLGDQPIIWLDEVFADKTVRTKGNLTRFQYMCQGFMSALQTDQLAFRTKNPAMIKSAKTNYNVMPESTAPDERAFIIIKGEDV